jgi:uncharacterized protein (DUF2062 family)
MVVPIVAKKRKEKNRKPLLQRIWPVLLGICFIGVVIAGIVVAITTGVKIFTYFN